MTIPRVMFELRIVRVVLCLLASAGPAAANTADVAVFRVFFTDGTSVPTYGEYVRVGDDVVFSMPLGPAGREPKLEVVTLPATSVDWARTEQYGASVRYQRYAATRGESDFALLTAEVAAMLNQIALTTEPARALEIAGRARRMLVDWPAAHMGYRQHDVADIVTLIDDAVRGLTPPSADGSVQFTLVAMAPTVVIEPILPIPGPREQVAHLVRLAGRAPRAADRMHLLEAALRLLDDPDTGIGRDDVTAARRSIASQLREERSIEARYLAMAKRLVTDARRSAREAQVVAVERVIERIDGEDARLGRRRPDTVQALRAELEAQLAAARDLRLRRDGWELRRHVYRAYVESVAAQTVRLVKAGASLDAIRRLAGPSPSRLMALKQSLSGGADRLQRMVVPEALRSAHEMLVAAWRFAESAADARNAAVASGDLSMAWQASSSAAGSMMLLTRAQAEMRAMLEPPR
jgi:hypothetical protein